MTSRKDQLREIFAVGITGAVTEEDKERARKIAEAPGIGLAGQGERAPSGAVKAMGLSLGRLGEEAAEARKLAEKLAAGDRVVELDARKIEPAFVSDRLSEAGEGDEAFATLKRSIADNGQQVPVLVRPHPDATKAADGRYQAAYGHRRIAAARALGRPVRAVVKALSDIELVVAQGKENAERRDLSFIERAFFADALIRRGFDRSTVTNALSLHKAEMTRLLQVAEAVPEHIARAIGPAPKAGRPRWLALARLLRSQAGLVKAMDEIDRASFRAATSDRRFQMLHDRLSKKAKTKSAPKTIRVGDREIAAFDAAKGRGVIAFSAGTAEGFAEYVAAELPRLHEDFARARKPEA